MTYSRVYSLYVHMSDTKRSMSYMNDHTFDACILFSRPLQEKNGKWNYQILVRNAFYSGKYRLSSIIVITINSSFRTVERLPKISQGLVDIECNDNDDVAFECKLNITQETEVRWHKDGKVCY